MVPQPVTSSSANLKICRWGSLDRSPTPPTQVIKSTYGGNVFTAQDVEYLKTYIDYCQRQGLVLSLREICERLAVKVRVPLCHAVRQLLTSHAVPASYVSSVKGRSITCLTSVFAGSTLGAATVTSIKSDFRVTRWMLTPILHRCRRYPHRGRRPSIPNSRMPRRPRMFLFPAPAHSLKYCPLSSCSLTIPYRLHPP